ncbi:Coenzyme A biosynthesis bifunctional protein CoaBC [Tsuneonella dongtanensis]|uniref:Coenzyme A biosynthesis bifunctional protein CoaBC n=1 Tax=Tsuneonella dongtanensis TaxID=692370 RepID=A0A1B2AH27_9SPHN|nr:bifunctional phosphopantothenoylcysteine decarboxylase/phosphopantothenate synthase [Tsuneonella dongtanensis]ANY21428.1 Coenzyme A biosynthesis bifunctional protein CoaBC [Tsuneonella dongtanensis]
MREQAGEWPQDEAHRVSGPKVLLVVGGGIAAYKSCELVRLIRRGGGDVTCVLTEGGSQFVTPMALAALSENKVYTSLFDLKDEVEMGHIQLSRQADLVVVCPATADLLAKMAAGIADDLATTLILATDKPVMAVPAMNVKMWLHDATRRNVAWLREAGVEVMEPDEGPMACGEFGPGRLPEPEIVWAEIAARFGIAADCEPEPDLLEALEPEAEIEAKPGSSLGSLLSSLIPRKTPKREPVEDDEEFLPEELIEEAAFADEAPVEEVLEAEEPLPEPDLDAPIMAKKGKAKAAPPTDAEALNHTVITGAGDQLPEVIGALAEDPLAYQPDFDIDPEHRPLFGRHVLVTAGPTHEPIDPVRYIANRSSGKQGFAIAAAAAALGARVTLVAGPVTLPTPPGVDRIDVISAREMSDAVKKALPVDAAVMVAAVADWRSKEYHGEKMKKRGSAPPALLLTENPDILAQVAAGKQRPKLLIGFAAETEDVIENAKVKRKRKAADWIVANDVTSVNGKGVMGGDANAVHIVTGEGVEDLPEMPKEQVALALAEKMAVALDEIDPREE